ncbi:Fc.00g019190.m01.CDS01 [Cosmosporella sp. VM-42]
MAKKKNNPKMEANAPQKPQKRPTKKTIAAVKPSSSATKSQQPQRQNFAGEHKSKTRGQKRRAKMKAQKEAATMVAQRNRTANNPVRADVAKYGLEKSNKRLENNGFHPNVTSMSLSDAKRAFERMVAKAIDLPTRDQYISTGSHHSKGFNQGNYTASKRLVKTIYQENPNPDWSKPNGLDIAVAGAIPWNRSLAVELAGDGFRTLQNLATASPRAWVNVASEMAIHDYNVCKFRGTPRGRVFLAVTPEYTIGDVKALVEAYLDNSDRSSEVSWAVYEWEYEGDVLEAIQTAYEEYGSVTPYWADNADRNPPRTVISSMFFVTAVLGRKEVTEVVHFQKTPMLDRRVLAVILRALPNVRMVGVYDCPLIHFGDVIALLDLIHDINEDRRRNCRPLIESLDFFPRYNYGTPYKTERSGTYGITWGPTNKDIIHRGQFRIVLEAYLKSSAMGISLLFDKGHAFCDYLSRLPGPPLAMAYFLDGLYRYLDLVKAGSTDINDLKQAMFDTLKPVRLGLEKEFNEHESITYYENRMGRSLCFCCSCGYEMLEEFTTASARGAHDEDRLCSGCLLRRRLDREMDHDKGSKRRALNCLFPGWNGDQFNPEAPLNGHGRGLLNLRSTETQRPSAPPSRPLGEKYGESSTPKCERPCVRYWKIHQDSVQGLPDLETLARYTTNIEGWTTAVWNARTEDIAKTTSRLLREDYSVEEPDLCPFADTRIDGGMTDHFDEHQPDYYQDCKAKIKAPPHKHMAQCVETSPGDTEDHFW